MQTPRNHHLLGSSYSFCGFMTVLFLLAGCCPTALTTYKSRPFFLVEEDVTTHGRKAWYDSIIELDPGGAEFTVAADYQEAPPKRIAVLPFIDLGEGDFVVNKFPLLPRSDEERERWGWSHANHLRRAFAGELATRDGHELFSCMDTRYATNFTPVFDPIDIVIGSILNAIMLRDINLARAEAEVGREIVHRLPVATRNVSDFKTDASDQEDSL